MPRHTNRCTACDWTGDVYVKPYENPPCPSCCARTERYFPIGGSTTGVIPDEWVGGKFIENMSHEGVWVSSRSEYKRELERRGLEQKVQHVGVKGSDKSDITTRWI